MWLSVVTLHQHFQVCVCFFLILLQCFCSYLCRFTACANDHSVIFPCGNLFLQHDTLSTVFHARQLSICPVTSHVAFVRLKLLMDLQYIQEAIRWCLLLETHSALNGKCHYAQPCQFGISLVRLEEITQKATCECIFW